MPSPAISRGRHFVFGQSVHQCVRNPILKVCDDILETACGNFAKFTTNLQLGTKMK